MTKREWAKPRVVIPIAVILAPLVCWGLIEILGWLYRMLPVKGLFKECNPQQLLAAMEDSFDLEFPDDITHIKAAQTPRSEGEVSFVIRFTIAPDAVDVLLASFPGGFLLKDYHPGDDVRAGWSVPGWYTKPIQKGRTGLPNCTTKMSRAGIDLLPIYIDTADEERYVVYWGGYH